MNTRGAPVFKYINLTCDHVYLAREEETLDKAIRNRDKGHVCTLLPHDVGGANTLLVLQSRWFTKYRAAFQLVSAILPYPHQGELIHALEEMGSLHHVQVIVLPPRPSPPP